MRKKDPTTATSEYVAYGDYVLWVGTSSGCRCSSDSDLE